MGATGTSPTMFTLHPYQAEPGVVALPTIDLPITAPTPTAPLIVDIADQLYVAWWDALAEQLGIPERRWRRHHPAEHGGIITVLGDTLVFDQAYWSRFASLAPGAVALPGRTAARLGVHRTGLQPPSPRPVRLVDLSRDRRARRRMRRGVRVAAANLARMEHQLQEHVVAPVTAEGDAGVGFAELPTYALALRLELALQLDPGWDVLAVIDLTTPPDDPLRAAARDAVRPLWETIWLLVDQLADRLAAEDQLASLDDAYELTLDELLRHARGTTLGARSAGLDSSH